SRLKAGRGRMHIAITGANSSVGATLLRHAADQSDVHVVACVRAARAAATLPEAPTISQRVVDYTDSKTLAAAVAGTTSVVHLAGILIEGAASTYQVANVDPTRATVAACRQAGVGHIVLVSVL